MKVFILGRPGSGKTTSARRMADIARNMGMTSIHVNDYEFLQMMFHQDTGHKRFRATEHEGFDVVDFSVMDMVLWEVEKRVSIYLDSFDIVTVEFARDDYCVALKEFSRSFLSNDSYFLYLDTDVDMCLQRIHERVAHRCSTDDHPSLSDAAFKEYYAKDNLPYISSELIRDYSLDSLKVQVIANTCSFKEFDNKLVDFISRILRDSSLLVSAPVR